MSARVAAVLYRWRRLLSALVVLGAVALAPLANITAIDNDLTAWFSEDDAVYREYLRFRDEFGGTRNLIVALVAPDRARLASREALGMIAEVTAEIERVDAVERVNSLATATVVDGRPGGSADDPPLLDVRPLFDDLATSTPEAVLARAEWDDLMRGDLISADGTTAALVVFFDERRIDDVRAAVLDRIHAIVGARLLPGFEAHFNGSLEISEAYNRITLSNQTRFTPPIFLFTALAIFVMFRSWRRTLLTLFAVLVSVVWTLGLYSLMGFSYNVLSSMIIPLVVVLAVADDVHIIQHFGEARRRMSTADAHRATVAHLLVPIFGASVTTALGMLSLATSSVVAVREFGVGAAVGVMVDFGISIVLVPTLLGWLSAEAAPAPQEAWFKGPMLAVARFSTRRARAVVVLAAVLTVVGIVGLTRVRVDTNHMNFFATDHPLGRAARVMDEKLAGIYNFHVFLEGPPDSLQTPDTLRRTARLQDELRALPFVRKVTSLPDYVRRVHRELSGDAAADLPGDAGTVAQELLVFSLADEGRAELSRVAASDYSSAQVTIKLASMSSDLVFEQIGIAERVAAEAFAGSEVRATVTGSGRLFATLDHYLVLSQLTSFAMAFVTVFAVIFLVFRSWRFGILAIVPNLFPVLAVFGVMGFLGISLNVATVMLASVALGVVDDDTIHFISRYRRETARGASSAAAIETATVEEGRAALTTALINSCAFAVLALSEYKPTAWFGGLLALTMGVAFLAEVFILPATITVLPRLFGADRVHASRRRQVPA